MDNKYISIIEEFLPTLLPNEDCYEKVVTQAMKYSLLAPGKRIRPTLLLAFCEACSGNMYNALPYACAVEMIHSYSLIHDDLPCMDDDDLRRGRPSNHIVFGEDIALLAGDALQTLAFESMLSEEALSKTGINGAKAAGILARAAGANGMVGGQTIDLTTEGKSPSLEIIKDMYSKKTGRLIKAPCVMGCVLAGADERKISAAEGFAENIGLAFQIVDDILDIVSDTNTLGKPVGSDKENGKVNYVTILGIEQSRKKVEELTNAAIRKLDAFENDTEFLRTLAAELAARIY